MCDFCFVFQLGQRATVFNLIRKLRFKLCFCYALPMEVFKRAWNRCVRRTVVFVECFDLRVDFAGIALPWAFHQSHWPVSESHLRSAIRFGFSVGIEGVETHSARFRIEDLRSDDCADLTVAIEPLQDAFAAASHTVRSDARWKLF